MIVARPFGRLSRTRVGKGFDRKAREGRAGNSRLIGPSHWTREFEGNSASADAAVAIRILRQILLVIVLGVEELRRVANLRVDRTQPCSREVRLVGALRRFGRLALLRIRYVDR